MRLPAMLFLCFLAAVVLVPVHAHERGPLNADETALLRQAQVLVIVPQDKIWAALEEVHIGQQFGFIGEIIDSMETSAAYNRMRGYVSPLHDVTPDLDFRRDFLESIRLSGLFDETKVNLAEQAPKNRKERSALLAAANGPAVLLEVHPALSNSYRTLTINASMTLWHESDKKAKHEIIVSYHSKPVVLSRAFLTTPLAMPRWIDGGGRAFRAAYDEGIRHTIELLTMMTRPVEPIGAGMEERIDWSDPAAKFVRRGRLVRQTAERAILLDGETLHSVAIAPTFESLKMHERVPNSSSARVFFYRTGVADTYFIEPSIFVNGGRLGELFVSAFSYVDLPPGRYEFAIKYDGDAPGAGVARSQLDQVAPVRLDLQARGQYFVRFDGYKGVWTKSDVLKTVDAETALTEIRSLNFGAFMR